MLQIARRLQLPNAAQQLLKNALARQSFSIELTATNEPATKTITLDQESREAFTEAIAEARDIIEQHGK